MRKFSKFLAFALVTIAVIAACSKTIYVAYTPTDSDAQKSGTSIEHLAKGQAIYSSSCTKCHSIDPPEKYTKAEWDKILPRMSKKAKLTASDSEILGVYIFARAKEEASK